MLIDSRGHGRSTRDARPFSYDLMASDVLAVMDVVGLDKSGDDRGEPELRLVGVDEFRDELDGPDGV